MRIILDFPELILTSVELLMIIVCEILLRDVAIIVVLVCDSDGQVMQNEIRRSLSSLVSAVFVLIGIFPQNV